MSNGTARARLGVAATVALAAALVSGCATSTRAVEVPVVDVGDPRTAPTMRLLPGYFIDSSKLAPPELEPSERVSLIRDLVWADVTGAQPGAVTRMFDAAPESQREELRYLLADALASAELQASINRSAARRRRALTIALQVAPPDPGLALNHGTEQQVARFDDWERYPYQAIIVTGYTPVDAESPIALHPVAAERAAAAAAAYVAGEAPFVLVSGANVHPHGTPYFEALELRKALLQLGVPQDRIVVDARARHSTTNLRNAGRIMLRLGMRRAVVVANGGGLSVFDQAFYFGHPEESFFHSRCERELGYRVGVLEALGGGRVAFSPSAMVRTQDYRDPLDP